MRQNAILVKHLQTLGTEIRESLYLTGSDVIVLTSFCVLQVHHLTVEILLKFHDLIL